MVNFTGARDPFRYAALATEKYKNLERGGGWRLTEAPQTWPLRRMKS